MQGGHKVISLQSGKVINCPKVTSCKINLSVIALVEARAKKDGVKTLKFFNRKRDSILLTPADLSTGVGENKNDDDSSDSDYVPSLEDD